MRARALPLALIVAAAACGGPAVLDGPEAEAAIADRLAETYRVTVDRVTCPDDVRVDEGATFPCDVAVGDEELAVEVRQTDDEGTLEVEPERAIVGRAAVEEDIARTLADRFSRDDVTVACEGPAVRVEAPGATFLCEAADGAERKQVEVRVRDARGALAYTLLDEAG